MSEDKKKEVIQKAERLKGRRLKKVDVTPK